MMPLSFEPSFARGFFPIVNFREEKQNQSFVQKLTYLDEGVYGRVVRLLGCGRTPLYCWHSGGVGGQLGLYPETLSLNKQISEGKVQCRVFTHKCFLFLFILVYECFASMQACTTHVCPAWCLQSLERVLNALEQELQMVVNYHVGSTTQNQAVCIRDNQVSQ